MRKFPQNPVLLMVIGIVVILGLYVVSPWVPAFIELLLLPFILQTIYALYRSFDWVILIVSLSIFILCLCDTKIRPFSPWHVVVISLCLIGGTFAIHHIYFQERTWAVSYGAVNHTDKSIVSIIINGEGGILNVSKHNAGNASVCCVIVPQRWRPGLTATIKWQEDGDWATDAQGKIIYKDSGVPLLIPAPWKTRTVPIPKYSSVGEFYVIFYPGDEVRAALTSSPEFSEWEKETPEDAAYQAKEYAQ